MNAIELMQRQLRLLVYIGLNLNLRATGEYTRPWNPNLLLSCPPGCSNYLFFTFETLCHFLI